jgi:ABC-type dipeptide/oligopeptide/nickel transport system ATPase component
MVETLSQRKTGFTQKDRDAYLCALLQEVGFSDPDAVLSAYPFELSGGMRQRVLLAMTISLQPRILIADEPTTALDAVNRDRVFSLLKKLQRKHGLTILLISHDQQSVHRFADRIVKMERGGCVR